MCKAKAPIHEFDVDWLYKKYRLETTRPIQFIMRVQRCIIRQRQLAFEGQVLRKHGLENSVVTASQDRLLWQRIVANVVDDGTTT